MIVYENGRYRSKRPISEETSVLTKELANLSAQERAAVEAILGEYGAKGKSETADEAEKVEWDPTTGPPIPIAQWVNDKYYLGETAETLFPKLKEDIIELFSGNYYECILCLHPETRIPLLDGTTPTIKELADRWIVDPKPYWVYSYKDGDYCPAQAVNPRQTGVDDYYRVTLDDGSDFVGNSRHQMIMCDGSKRMIKDMATGDSIMPFRLNRSTKTAGDPIGGYEKIRLSDDSQEFTHRLVARLLCEKRDGDEDTVHHVDFRKENNTPENLRWMRWNDHTRLHTTAYAEWAAANPERAIELGARRSSFLTALWKEPSADSRRLEHSKRLTELNNGGMASIAGKVAWKNRSPAAKIAFHEMMVARNKSPEMRAKVSAAKRSAFERRHRTQPEWATTARVTKHATRNASGDWRTDVTMETIRASGATSLNEAAELLACSMSRVRRVLQQNGYTQISFFGNRRGRKRGVKDLSVELIKEAIAGGSTTVASAAKYLGRYRTTLWKFLSKNGLTWEDLYQKPGRVTWRVTIDQIRDAVKVGSATKAAVAARLGCHESTVSQVVARAGLKWRDISKRKRNHYIVKIERCGQGPVYCMTVPDAGNFAIATTLFDGKEVQARCSGVISGNTGSIG